MRRLSWWALVLALLPGCLPYVVATTAMPAPVGEVEASAPVYLIPGAIRLDSLRYSGIGFDLDARIGLSPRSDIGFRIPTLSGIVVSYKQLLTDPERRSGLALMPAVGFFWSHGYADLTAVASGPVDRAEWYGGVRAMGTVPLAAEARTLPGSIGGVFGLKIPGQRYRAQPEIGVFYGPAGLQSESARVNVVLSIAFSAVGAFPRLPSRWP
ncbi:MAG: hypothetical protein AB7L66_12710 [Gemmatimonadales bacterium]